MLHTKKLLHLENSAVYIKHTDENIEIIDNCFIHYQLDKNVYDLKKRVAIQKDLKVFEHTKIFDISSKSLHVYPKNSTKSLLFIENKGKLRVAGTKKMPESIAVTKFSNNGKMMLAGSENGDIWLLDVDLDKIIYTLSPRPDEISSIVFSKDDKFVAIASYDKKIEVYNTLNWSIVCSFSQESVTEDILFSNNNQYIYTVDRDGFIVAFDIFEQKSIYKQSLGQHWLSAIENYNSNYFAIVGTRDNSLLIINLQNGEIIKNILLKNKGLNSISFSDETSCMAFSDGSILMCDMLINKDEALVALKMQDYKMSKQIIDENILLYLDGTMDELLSNADKELPKIITLIELGNTQDAIDNAQPFMLNESFGKKFSEYISNSQEIAQFVKAVDEKNFLTAYTLADKYEYIKSLKKYQQLENLWFKSFNEAKNLISKNPNDGATKIRAKTKLQSFLNVASKRRAIKNLLENSKVFFQADNYVREKKFIQFFKLCEEYPFLEDTQIYNKVISITQLLLTNISKAVQQKEYKNAISTARRLLSFTPVKDEASRHIKEISAMEKFTQATQNKDLISLFELVEKNQFLENLLEYKYVMQNFNKINEDAKTHAISGDIQKTFYTIGKYVSINHVKDHIAFTIKLAYLNSIPTIANDQTIDWKRTFTNYIELYGKDPELQKIAIENGVLDIYDSIDEEAYYQGYKNKTFKNHIVAVA